jgi:disulfide bond formation protein DsbB
MRNLSSLDLALFVLMLSSFLLGTAVFIEHSMGMDPCPLCLMQRFWLFLCALIAAASVIHNPNWGIYPLLTSICAVLGGLFSLRQLWLQNASPSDAVGSCGMSLSDQWERSMISFWDLLITAAEGTIDCAKPDLIFGVSIPAWMLLFFVLITLISIQQIRKNLS